MLLLKKTIWVIPLFYSSLLSAQSNTLSAGGDASSAGGSISYSVGQIDYVSSSSSSGNINQGNQQPYEFYASSGLSELEDLIQLTLGPNPTIDYLTLSVKHTEGLNLSYFLTDMNGKILLPLSELHSTALLNMTTHASGIYHLIIMNGTTAIKTYKISKN